VRGGQADEAWNVAQGLRTKWPPASFLAELDAPVLRDFLSAGEVVTFGRGDTLIGEGDVAVDMFLLLDASVKVTARLDGGGHALLAVRVGGDVVVEVAVMNDGQRTASVSNCGTDRVIAVRLGQDDLRDLLARHPGAAFSFASAIGRKLHAATRRRVDITGCSPTVCMARVLLEMAEDYGRPEATGIGTLIGVNITQIELGTLVGVRGKTAQRALHELRENKVVVSYGRRRLLVPDMAALRSVAWSTSVQITRGSPA
jgi:CRP/FNR family cyclic AMP-dependent transcriptional regulator